MYVPGLELASYVDTIWACCAIFSPTEENCVMSPKSILHRRLRLNRKTILHRLGECLRPGLEGTTLSHVNFVVNCLLHTKIANNFRCMTLSDTTIIVELTNKTCFKIP